MTGEESSSYIPWLHQLASFRNDMPKRSEPYVRTKHINSKKEGCFVCGRKSNLTRHHITRGERPIATFICWKHHQLLHGVALDKKHAGRRKYKPTTKKWKYYYSNADLRMVLTIGIEYNLFKYGEKGMVVKRIQIEIERRVQERINREANGEVVRKGQ